MDYKQVLNEKMLEYVYFVVVCFFPWTPQATLKIQHIRSLDYRPRQHSCLIQGLRVYNNLDSIVWYNIQHSPGQGSSLQVCVSDPGQDAPPFAASVRTVLICVPPPQVTLQVPNSPHTQSTGTENKKILVKEME